MGDTKHSRPIRFVKTADASSDDLCTRIGKRLTKDMTVLELCCGTGRMTLPLCGSVALWEAVDPSPAKITEAKRIPHSDRLRFSVMDPASLPYEHSGFDAVVIANALHTLPRPDPVLREIRRVLRPDGILFAPTYMFGGRKKVKRPNVCRKWTAAEFIDWIGQYGFAVEKAVLLPERTAPICYLEARNQK